MNSTQKPQSTLQKLSKSLNVSETEILIAIKQMGLNPTEIDETWENAIANHLTGTKPPTLTGTKPPTEPESFSIEDSDFVNWEEVEGELGDGALNLVEELGLEPEAITRSDLAALRELRLSNPVHQNLADHIGAVGSVQAGLTNEHIRTQYETGAAIGEAGNTALIMGMLQSQLTGLQQAYALQTSINDDFQKVLNAQLESLGKRNQGKPSETVQSMGKQATDSQQTQNKTSTVRSQKLDILNIKNSLNK